MSLKITCLKRGPSHPEHPYLGIDAFGYDDDATHMSGSYTRAEMYDWLVNGGHAYVDGPTGTRTYLVAMEDDAGVKYVRSTEDDTSADDLLTLPEAEHS